MNRPAQDRAAEDRLATFAAELGHADLTEDLLHSGRRSLVNIFATAFTGCAEEAISILLETEAPFAAPGNCTLIGRGERTNPALAACLNGAGANIFDFDDTHEATIIHPAAPVFPALFALAEARSETGKPVAGRDLLRAFILGCEVECRIGNAMSPEHYARGWHITSTCGIFGAAAATGHLLGLSPERMRHAFSAAAAQSAGLVETLGTMAKSVSVGNAARLGFMSALLAAQGLTGPARPLSGTRGYLRVYADAPRIDALTAALGSHWEAASNTYKPYPVGVVLNPVIEAVLDMREADGLRLPDVARIELTGHPLLRQRTDRADAATGRETQVSAQHAVAIALLRGTAGLAEFGDAAAAATLAAGRPEIEFTDSDAHGIDSIEITVHLSNGRRIGRQIDHAAGSRARPLTDGALETKLSTAAKAAGFKGDIQGLIAALWKIDSAPDAAVIVRMAAAAP
ncbi:MmgE/PrpD family protein [Pararhodobacter sp. SW119]|uniref:MmgE/PrpD family protein n=1 Tax=Pararhodobacter sp. SW119 TaxID=2780075 RepID=UPI001AE03E1E|nr:MmgE/PrpD family protein [Pararhodobacter sp. SW119]